MIFETVNLFDCRDDNVADHDDRYDVFLRSKVPMATPSGFEPLSEPHESLKPHQLGHLPLGDSSGASGNLCQLWAGQISRAIATRQVGP